MFPPQRCASLRAPPVVGLAMAVALVACGQAGAAPASGISAPPGWQALPQLATAAKDALGKGVTVDGAEAWGEPARGCYAVWLAVAAKGDTEAIAGHIIEGFATPALKIAVRDVVKPGADGVLALAFERAPYRGRLRAKIGGDRVAALACFDNRREPKACEDACTSLLGVLR